MMTYILYQGFATDQHYWDSRRFSKLSALKKKTPLVTAKSELYNFVITFFALRYVPQMVLNPVLTPKAHLTH